MVFRSVKEDKILEKVTVWLSESNGTWDLAILRRGYDGDIIRRCFKSKVISYGLKH